MAKKAAKKAAAKTPRKTAARKTAAAAPAASAEEFFQEEEDHLDFTTAREVTDHRKIDSPVLVSFLVDDLDGNEHCYQCRKEDVPQAAAEALGWTA